MDSQLMISAQEWIADDPDAETKNAGQAILNSGDEDTIRSHFGQRLSFGTAGLRGEIGPGPNRMNRALVRRVTCAVGRHLIADVDQAIQRGIVIGYDGRHGSYEFAHDALSVLGALGFKVYIFDSVIPTPRLAHAIRVLEAAGGIMVTASHNPPRDNGYKVFWSDSAQIIPPHDVHISSEIDKIASIDEIPFESRDALIKKGLVSSIPEFVHKTYFDEISALRVYDGPTDIRIVYSAMHGVGTPSVQNALKLHGYDSFYPVPEQADPDPDFPTVSFPNPEEPGAMDLSVALGKSHAADVVLANDPDADRLCVALPNESGEFELLTGNEVGILLADELLSRGQYSKPLVVTTIVSTRLLSRLASHYGVEYAETLTGFKWIAHKALAHKRNGGEFVMGFEEALGYSVGPVVRDKDGVSATLLFADIVARCKTEGRTVWDQLEAVYRRHGYHCTTQKSFKYTGEEGQARIAAILDTLRNDAPGDIGGVRVVRYRDLSVSKEWNRVSGEELSVDLPKSNVLSYELENGSQILVRPSGTEPKIKFYFEVCEPCHSSDSFDDFRRRGQSNLQELAKAMLSILNL